MATTVVPLDSESAAVTRLYQWDTGVTLYIADSKIDDAYNVHFANRTSSEAAVCSSTYSDNTLTVTIPDELLQEALPIYGYVYVEKNGMGRTEYVFKINVIKRAQPSDYIYDSSGVATTIALAVEAYLESLINTEEESY